jgi:hypothetical protein
VYSPNNTRAVPVDISSMLRGAQFPGRGALPARPVERPLEIVLGSGCLWGPTL